MPCPPLESVLSRVPGVGEVQIMGSGYAMRIWLDPDRLTKYGLSTADVVTAIRSYNAEISAGQLSGLPAVPGQRLNASIIVQSYLINAAGVCQHSAADESRRVGRGGERYRANGAGLRDAGHSRPVQRPPGRHGGHPTEAGANALDTADGVRAAMTDLAKYFRRACA